MASYPIPSNAKRVTVQGKNARGEYKEKEIWVFPSPDGPGRVMGVDRSGDAIESYSEQEVVERFKEDMASRFALMATDIDGKELRNGDRVRVVTSGQTSTIVGDPDDAQVHLADGSSAHPKKVQKMERTMDAVDMARATRCPYCTKTVAMSRRALGDHRAEMGFCAGSGRRVAEFDSCGRVVFEAAAQTFARDSQGKEIRVGAMVAKGNGRSGRVIETSGSDDVKIDNGLSEEWVKASDLVLLS